MDEGLGKCFLALLAFVGSAWCQDIGQITENIIPDIKRVGETGYLNCTVTGQKDNAVQWIFDSKKMVISSNNAIDLENAFNPIIYGNYKYDVRRTILGDRSVYTLILRRLESTDAGIYRCQLDVKGVAIKPYKDGELIVLAPPTISQSQTTQTITVDEGENATLHCNAQGYPNPRIKWVRGNGINIPNPYDQFSVAGEVLKLVHVDRGARGVYRCIGDNDVRPPATYDVTLYVNFKPHAKSVQTTYGQAPNRMFDVVIECRISGFPDPDMQWFKLTEDLKGRTEIKDDDEHDIHVLISHSAQELSISEFWYQMKIINVQSNDYAIYECEGNNKLGIGSDRIKVYETSECQGPDCPPDSQGPSGAIVIIPSSFLALVISGLLSLIVLH